MGTKKTEAKSITITAPNFQTINVRIAGTSPLMQAKFSAKTKQAMAAKMAAGSTAKSKNKKPPRDFDADFIGAQHISTDGWVGIPAAAFRNACIDVCRMVGFKMTHAKMSVFAEADGLDTEDASPLIRLDAGDPERSEMTVRNATGVVDIRVRPLWREWAANVRLRFDADQFTTEDVINLLSRAGAQVGIGEGRPFSKSSNGLGFGLFAVQDFASV
jgi:hypothetical protein